MALADRSAQRPGVAVGPLLMTAPAGPRPEGAAGRTRLGHLAARNDHGRRGLVHGIEGRRGGRARWTWPHAGRRSEAMHQAPGNKRSDRTAAARSPARPDGSCEASWQATPPGGVESATAA